MSSANLGPVPYFTVFDANGSPVSGAKIYTYVASSSTPANTYTDRGAGTTNANPVVCDSAGRATIFFDDSVVYKLVVKDANDVTLVTVDNYSVNPVIAKATTLTISGNGTIGGTFAITGNTTVGGTLGVTGNFAVNTNKFTVTASSGNTAVAGTLGVTGALTLQSNAIAATANRFLPHQAMARVSKSGTQSLNNNTDTAVTFDTETFDTDGIHDTVTNNSRLTAPVTGKYLVAGTAHFAASATGYRQAKILKNGATGYGNERSVSNTAGDEVIINVLDIVDLAAGEYVELFALQNSGGALNLQTASTFFSMVLVGV